MLVGKLFINWLIKLKVKWVDSFGKLFTFKQNDSPKLNSLKKHLYITNALIKTYKNKNRKYIKIIVTVNHTQRAIKKYICFINKNTD